ncbi:hypothetical protein Asi02nite_26830 [Asanoa siamensis]|uniref:Uncharacterized protein n=1 Tax=Asanoa siamensis TaxID=926357 RepID=A0ABQ4CPG0_9ACTN|nr:hypothetical protein Asi02nite_26830 [Asanoa siamensis]
MALRGRVLGREIICRALVSEAPRRRTAKLVITDTPWLFLGVDRPATIRPLPRCRAAALPRCRAAALPRCRAAALPR